MQFSNSINSNPFEILDNLLLSKNGKIIHQIWFGNIPNKKEAKKTYEKLKTYKESWRIKNPTWFCVEWDKNMCTQLIKKEYPEYHSMFKKYKHEIQRCDMARYAILHRYGGWYADMDYYCNKPLDTVHENYKNNFYLVETSNTFMGTVYVSNSLMYSEKNHPFWKKLLLEMQMCSDKYTYWNRHVLIMYTTGPGIINRVYRNNKILYKLKSLPYQYFHPYGIGDDKISLKLDDVYTIHLGKGSWEKKDSNIFLFFYLHWKLLLFIAVMFLLCIILIFIVPK